MAIFGRRRALSNPRPSTTSTSSAATLAASQAFLANKNSNANLSSAAATAALRTHTPTPTPVGQIQTKRMQRRGSITSQASAPAGTSGRPGGLQRRDSGGSMTERTFRTSSPNALQDRSDRPASSHGPYPRYDHDDAPPVPTLPKHLASVPSKTQTSKQRPASVEPPQRLNSPTPKQAGGRVVSLDRGPGVMTPPPVKGKAKKTLNSVNEQERAGQRSSVNFSRPMSPQNSPPTSPLASGPLRATLPAGTSPMMGLAAGENDSDVASLQTNAAIPVKKKKKKIAPKGQIAGSSLTGVMSSDQPSGATWAATTQRQLATAISAPSPAPGAEMGEPNAAPQPKKKKKKKAAQEGEARVAGESFGAAYPSDTDSVTSERSSTTDRPRSYNTRAAGLLAKQPSMVREDPEGEKQAEGPSKGSNTKASTTASGASLANTPANTSKTVSRDRQSNRAISQQTPTSTSKLDVPSAKRTISLSPGRAARFSAEPVNEGAKHQPPGRSVSPAKSALKYSPSRGHSPNVTRSGLAPSDASDSASQYSDEGSRLGTNKKKSARVSFDDGAIVVGRAASPPVVPDSPLILSPQNKSAKTRTWIDLIREQNPGNLASEKGEDDAIKPTPALPSFGSIRDRKEQPQVEEGDNLAPGEDWAKDTLRSMDTSTDAAVAHLIAADAATKQTGVEPEPEVQSGPRDPLPPQVTSVEGTGYHSDEGDLFDEGEKKPAMSGLSKPLERQEDVKGVGSQPATLAPEVESSGAHLPSIAVQPATPALDSAVADRDSWLGMADGVPAPKRGEVGTASRSDPSEHHTPATVGIAEPEPEASAAQHDSSVPVVGEVAETLRTQIEGESGDESEETAEIYSDAAEDQSDLEGDGFGSINAIVESPTSPNIAIAGKSPPASPGQAPMKNVARPNAAQRRESELSEPASAEGWDRAQAYWSGLSLTRKQQLEQAALPGAIDEPVIQNRSMRGADAVHRKKKKTKKVPPQPLDDKRSLQSLPGPILPVKSSLRPSASPADSAPHLRSSMRDKSAKLSPSNVDKRNSATPQPTPKPVVPIRARPVSAVAMVDYNRNEQKPAPKRSQANSSTNPVAPKKSVPVQQQKQFPAARPKAQRANSDSDSSFKKARPKTPDGSRYQMKRSMRDQSDEPVPSRVTSMVARTASPADSTARRPFSSTGASGTGGMRTSMRASADVSKPARTSLRLSMDSNKASRTKSPSRFSFMGSSKAKSVATESKPASRFSSRFGDSSDEEQGLPTKSSSRFADSSDDDDDGPKGLRPVRGIPRHVDEGDSTDLDDSSEEKNPVHMEDNALSNGVNVVNGTNGKQAPAVSSPEGTALATGSLRTPSGTQPPTVMMGTGLQAKKSAEKAKKKNSIFGSLSRKKRDPDIGSPARRDGPLESTKTEPMTIIPEASETSGRVPGPSSTSPDAANIQTTDAILPPRGTALLAQNSPKSPKLQRRNTPKRITSSNDISWPLPQSSADTLSTPPRPRTSDGPATRKDDTRPSLALRHSVQASAGNLGISGAASQSTDPAAKKKKFSLLRKAFGLHT